MIQRLLAILGSLRVTVVGLLFLLALTILGTLYQVENGLYRAQEHFYQSWGLLVGGFLPFPGAQLVMSVLFVNLCASMVLLAWRRRMHVGVFTTHFGLMLMLAAGAVTFYLGKESQLSLVEGEGSNVAMSFKDWELVILPPSVGTNRQVSALSARALKPGRTIALPVAGLALRVEEYYRNCEAARETSDHPVESGAGFTVLKPRPLGKEPAEDVPGVAFTLLENGREAGRYLVWGGDSSPTALQAGGTSRLIGLRRERLPLPAVIQLVDFRREMHPGSGIAKSYSSQVLVRSGQDLERRVLISMNKPLRLRGFTFYQSSFSSAPGGRELSTFSVVQNYGRLMPYLATGLTVAGMLLHFTGMLVTRVRRRASQGARA